MELLKFIAGEFLHIEPKAYFLHSVLGFQGCHTAPEMERSGLVPKLVCRIRNLHPITNPPMGSLRSAP